jgi:outer membrane protein assembly factor BamB
MRVALCLALATLAAAALAQEKAEDHFDVVDVGPPGEDVPGIEPWKVTELDPDYGGQWVVAGDLDGDGDAELVSAENVNENDTHYTSAVSAQELDGSVLWRWGDAEAGRKTWHHDVACQVHDWNGDGRLEVAVATEGFLVELDGATGDERRRIAIPPGATDCLVFCDLAGRGRRGEVLIKDRYHRIWALDYEGDVLWSVTDP